jgi:hypothetical protein
MRRMFRSDVEISTSVGGSPLDFDGQCRPFPGDQNIQKRMKLSDSIYVVKWIDG